MTQPRAVFFDRDGVLNEAVIDGDAVRGPWSLAELRVRSDAADAVARRGAAGYLPVVVTNQPDVVCGKLAVATADAIDRQVRAEVGIDVGYECRHDDDAACACRKPRPGMLLDAARDHDLDLGASWLIGDRWVDVVAARAAGCGPSCWNGRGAAGRRAAGTTRRSSGPSTTAHAGSLRRHGAGRGSASAWRPAARSAGAGGSGGAGGSVTRARDRIGDGGGPRPPRAW